MSDYSTQLPVPHPLLSYRGTIKVEVKVGDESKLSEGPVKEYITIYAGFPCEPLVTCQARDLRGAPNGPCFKWDQAADSGRGVWVIYDPDLHEIPQINATLLEDEPPSDSKSALDISAASRLAVDQAAYAPNADDPAICSDDECECDEPTCESPTCGGEKLPLDGDEESSDEFAE